MQFRQDINGLRAFAVIGVLLFHFNASWMPGGFAGVDVFFVISGFLMTGIIFRGIEQEKFSILNFYVARANRIIPALALLCLVLLVFGWFYLTPLEYKALGKHAASSVGFLSNFIYWKEAGYFDAASHEKWLLHTWTLSVEWQFYIIYPLILVAMRKFLSIKMMKSILIVGTVLGFIFSVIATYKLPNASYYLLPMRAWEMMIGGVAYLYPFALQENRKKLLERIGLVLVVGSYFLISAENAWPGYLTLFPVMGSFLIIQAQRNDSIITNNIVFQKIGTWSYSIYLWHWPLVVIIYTFALPEYYIYLGMALSILLGFLSYKYVEKINFPRSFPTLLSYLKCKPVYIAGIIGVLGIFLYLKSDSTTTYRLSKSQISIVEQIEQDPLNKMCNEYSENCISGNGPVKAIVIGDSHAALQMAAIGKRASLFGGSVIGLTLGGCPTIKDAHLSSDEYSEDRFKCAELVNKALELVKNKYPKTPVIIINRYSLYLHGYNEASPDLEPYFYFIDQEFPKRNAEYKSNLSKHMLNTVCEFTKTNPVYLLTPIPELKVNVPREVFNIESMRYLNHNRVKIPLDEYNERQSDALNMQSKAIKNCGVKVLNPLPYLCDSNSCYGDSNGIPLYLDDDHLSSYGSEVISPIYDEVFKRN